MAISWERISKPVLAGCLALLGASTAFADFFHNPILCKDPYEVVDRIAKACKVETIAPPRPQRYEVGDQEVAPPEGESLCADRKRALLAKLQRTRDALLGGNAALPLPRFQTPLGGYLELGDSKDYRSVLEWLKAFPFPSDAAPDLEVLRIPDDRIEDLRQAMEVFPFLFRREISRFSSAPYFTLMENLIFLKARNISLKEFPDCKRWVGDIPKVIDRIRTVFEKGGRPAAEVLVSGYVRYEQMKRVGFTESVIARDEFPGEAERILRKIGPAEALPGVIDAYLKVDVHGADAQNAAKLLRLIRLLDDRRDRPKGQKGDAWMRWYEERWGAWSGKQPGLPDLSPVELDPQPEVPSGEPRDKPRHGKPSRGE